MVRLVLVNEQGSPPQSISLTNTPLVNELGSEITLQISDIQEPENGNGSFSKVIDIPGTNDVDIFFEDAYSVNVNLLTFNPNLKVSASYYKEENRLFNGFLQLLSVDVDEQHGRHVYKCNIIGEVMTLFTKIKDKQLEELSPYFSSTNHALSAAVIYGSWTHPNPAIQYFVYPLFDRGQAGTIYNGIGVDKYAGNGCYFLWRYIDAIFQAAGMTFTSTFMNSTFFKKLVLTTNKVPQLDPAIVANNKFLANPAATQTLNKALTNITPFFTLPFSSDTVNYASVVYNAGSVFSNPNYTPAVTKEYNVKGDFLLDIILLDAGANNVSANYTIISGTVTLTIASVGNFSRNLSELTFGNGGNNAFSVSVENKTLLASSTILVGINLNQIQVFKNTGADAVTMRFNITAGAFSSEFSANTPFIGQQINHLDLIPEDYTQDELLSDVKRMFNLQFSPDKNNPNNLIIEPYNTFYGAVPKDWTYKHDKKYPTEIVMTSDLDASRYKWRYQPDSDFFNANYESTFKKQYGEERKQIENDFIKNEKVIETKKLTSTALVGNQYSGGMVISTWREQDEFTIKEFKGKPRILYWAGMIAASNNAKPVKFAFDGNFYSSYPYAGHLDNPFNPTIDLNFGLVDYVYYTKPNQNLTDNNLYNQYYSRMMRQLVDKNSKIVKCRMNLSEEDISTFDFRFPVFTSINDEPIYALVNKIIFDPTSEDSAYVELLKLVDYPLHTPQNVLFNNGLGDTDTGTARTVNQPMSIGESINYGENSLVIGNESFIPEGSNNVLVIGDSIVYEEQVSNEANFFESFKVNPTGVEAFKVTTLQVNTDFEVEGDVQVYEVDLDTIGVNITADWDATLNFEVTFKIIANSGGTDLIINNTKVGGSVELSGSSITLTPATMDCITFYSNGNDIFIKSTK
jgi:hypothetical protein